MIVVADDGRFSCAAGGELLSELIDASDGTQWVCVVEVMVQVGAFPDECGWISTNVEQMCMLANGGRIMALGANGRIGVSRADKALVISGRICPSGTTTTDRSRGTADSSTGDIVSLSDVIELVVEDSPAYLRSNNARKSGSVRAEPTAVRAKSISRRIL